MKLYQRLRLGIFDFFKKEKKEKESIELPFIVSTENVNKVLLEVSSKNNIPLSLLDFSIIDYKTFIKVDKEDFVEIKEADIDILKREEFLRDEKNIIKQVYEIEVKKLDIDEIGLVGEMKNNKLLTCSKFLISPESLIPPNEKLIIEELYKKKLKSRMLIGIFEDEFIKGVERLLSKIRVFGYLDKKEEIILCKAIDPVPTIKGRIIYHYKKEKAILHPVKEGEIIIEIIKPKEGKNGRDCRGEIIKVEKLNKFEFPNFKFNPKDIKKEEDEDRIIYIARRDGYFYKEFEFLYLKEEAEVKQINLKTGNVKDAADAKVKLEVKEKSALKEAIADGMVVESGYLIVRGNVGNKAVVHSKEVKIEGQTHKNSLIESQKAEVNIHRGTLIAKEAFINRLEGGVVRAKKAVINQAIGGRVIAEEIEFEKVGSHVKATALKEIKIKNLIGNENIFKISPSEVLDASDDINKIEKEIEELKRNLKHLIATYKKRVQVIQKNKPAVNELYKKYLKNKEKGIKTSATIIKKIKEFKEYQNSTKEIKAEIERLKKEIEELKELLYNLQNIIFVAKIINYSGWREYNRIEFDLISPPVKLIYDTKGDEGVCGFKLKDFGDEFRIVKIKVEDDSST